jgi:hypothetical protein
MSSKYHCIDFYKLSDFTDVLANVGLSMDEKTGGFLAADRSFTVSSNPYSSTTQLHYEDGSDVLILDGKIFLDSLKHTEKSFKISLFTG